MKNIVYLHTHDTGRCISPYGYALDTPHLMKFARGAALFRQAFDCGPTCSPARASLLTGQYPHQCGVLGLAHRGFLLNDPAKHLANFLRSNGYHTVLCGIQHEASEPEEHTLNYSERYREKNESNHPHDGMGQDLANTAKACEFLGRPHPQPFFLSLGLFATHRPYPETPDAIDDPGYMKPPTPIPDTPACRRDWAAFATMVRHADRCFGQVFAAIAANRLSDDTLILVTTDHGVAFPGMKCNLNNHGCGVMFLLKVPGLSGGIVSEALISHLDFYPTVCEWAGLNAPDWLEGKSLYPLLHGEFGPIHDAVFAEINYHAARDVQRTIRTPRYRYVRRGDAYPKIILPNIDDGLTKRFLRREADLDTQPRIAEEQLFDLWHDPEESRSVAAETAYRPILIELRNRLDHWMRDTADPLLTGPVTAPAAARVNRQSGIEPDDGDFEQ